MPIDVQVIFVLGLSSRQNSSAFVHLTVAPRYFLLENIFMVRCGSKNHDLFVAEGDDWVYAGGADCGDGAGGYGDAEQDYRDGEEGAPVAGGYAVEQ